MSALTLLLKIDSVEAYLNRVGVVCLGGKKSKDNRVYTFAFSNDGFPANFIENGKLVGQSVDLVKAVCKFAGRKCKTSVVQRSQCWDNSQGFPPFSLALNNGWFGSCANLPPNPERKLSYSFGGEDFYRTPEPAVIVKTGSPIKIEDLQDCNDFSLAYAANTAVEPDCLLDAGLFVKTQKIIPVLTQGVFDLPTVMRKIAELVINGTVDMGLTIPRFLTGNGEFKTLLNVPCAREVPLGLNIMMKQDDSEFIEWWSDAVHEFMCSPKYKKFCEDQEDEYGVDPLCRRPGYDLDCTRFGGDPKTIGPVEPHRINPCIGAECPNPKQLVFGQTFFNLRDSLGKGAYKGLFGSGDEYVGDLEKDVRFVLEIGGQTLFTVKDLCVTVKDVKAVKFVFRGGLRDAEEVNLPVSSENKWTKRCTDHTTPRKLVVIKFRVAEKNTKDPRVKIKNVSMGGCIQ